MLSRKTSTILFSVSVLFILYAVNGVSDALSQLGSYTNASCRVDAIASSYHKCCHFVREVCYRHPSPSESEGKGENKGENKNEGDKGENKNENIPFCLRRHIELAASDDITTHTDYCLLNNTFGLLNNNNNNSCDLLLRTLECGKCSQHDVSLQSLSPAIPFQLKVSHSCDFRKVRCADKIFSRFFINETLSCWSPFMFQHREISEHNYYILSTPMIREFVIYGGLVLLAFILFLFFATCLVVAYKQYYQELQVSRENDEFELDKNYFRTYRAYRSFDMENQFRR